MFAEGLRQRIGDRVIDIAHSDKNATDYVLTISKEA